MNKEFKLICSILLLFGCLFASFIKIDNKEKSLEEHNTQIMFFNFVGMNIDDARKYASDNNVSLNIDYEYSYDFDKDIIISESNIDSKVIDVIVSKGRLTSDIYKENKVNELGDVPIMMYHGIVDIKDTKYIGGNVDRDGYNRTVLAFRNDLEFYYNNGYRMIRLSDYVDGIIDVELGKSPIILTFDDGNENNFKVLGEENGELIIDPNCAVGILEEFKRKYPDYNVTATFFLMNNLFNQKEYNEEIMRWLVKNNYDIGNHTINHTDFTKVDSFKTQEVVGKMYQKLESIISSDYVPIIALPYGSPYKISHSNYPYILKGNYEGNNYETIAALRVGWDSELSPFNKKFDKTFLKRCRAYDNNGVEFDIKMVFNNLEKTRFISDGNKDIITIKEEDSVNLINNSNKKIIKY